MELLKEVERKNEEAKGRRRKQVDSNCFHFIRFGSRKCSSSKCFLQTVIAFTLTRTVSRFGLCHSSSLIPHPSNYVFRWRANQRFGYHLLFFRALIDLILCKYDDDCAEVESFRQKQARFRPLFSKEYRWFNTATWKLRLAELFFIFYRRIYCNKHVVD